jgi:hypothetical protein
VAVWSLEKSFFLLYFSEWIRGFDDLLRQKPFILFKNARLQ